MISSDLMKAQLAVVAAGSPIDGPSSGHSFPPENLTGVHGRPHHVPDTAREQNENPPRPRGRVRGASVSVPSLRLCDSCRKLGENRYFCNLCTVTLCERCWDFQLPHRLGKRGVDNVPHEKTDHTIAEKIQASLEPSTTEAEQEELHRLDDITTWFGVGRDEMDEPVFQDYGRYATLMAQCSSTRRVSRYPGLVSFVGQTGKFGCIRRRRPKFADIKTGAGKSTLIKMLIELRPGAKKGSVPIVGSPDQSVPTSGDVHLYSDPETFLTDHPMLYADCEGLEGGEREPIASKAKHKDKSNVEDGNSSSRRTGSFQKKLRKKHHSSQREIRWANTPERRTREFAVTNLYPRLLYTFSDVVVFVLKNPRSVASTL